MLDYLEKEKGMIRWSMYRWAPETFRCSVNGKAINLLDPSRIGQLVVAGRTEEAEAEIKRIVRAKNRKKRWVTFGFFGENSATYYFTFQLRAEDDNLADKLHVYKTWKEECRKKNLRIGRCGSCEITYSEDGTAKLLKTGERNVKPRIDLSRPVKIRLVS
jgi:hypothetical protein